MYKVSKKNIKKSEKQKSASKKETDTAAFVLQDNRPKTTIQQKAQQLISNYTPRNTPFQKKNAALTDSNTQTTAAISLKQMHPQTQSDTIQGAFKYTSAVHLEPIKGLKMNTVTASDLKIMSIDLPEKFRPKTQYGIKQKSHSISWTLLKRVYTSIKNMNLDFIISDYLMKDWNALRKQKSFIKKNTDASKRFNKYLNTYTQNHFKSLLRAKKSDLQFHNEIKKAVSDYFIALQLAPLTTHTEHDSKNKNQKNYVATYSGEGAATTKLNEIEEKLKNKSDTPQSLMSTAIDKIKAYWDTGAGSQYGINNHDAIILLGEKLMSAIERMYPNIWANYHKDIQKQIIDPVVDKAKNSTFNNNSYSDTDSDLDTDSDADTDTDTDTNSKAIKTNTEEFHAQIHMKRRRDTQKSSTRFTANQLVVKELSLSNDRPPTKYFDVQKSHTVAWTLTLNALRNSAKNKLLILFIDQMIHHWELLKSQDWDEMISSKVPEIKNNASRLKNLQENIDGYITQLTNAKKQSKTSLLWVYFIQDIVSKYIETHAAAPLTTFKDGKPIGKGEIGANNFFTALEKKPTTIDWKKKFHEEFVTKKTSKPKMHQRLDKKEYKKILFKPDEKMIKLARKKYQKDKKFNPDNLYIRKKQLTRQMALKYLDVKWGQARTYESAKKRVSNMAMIHYTWIDSIRNTFPEVWKQYKDIFMETANQKEISPGIKNKLNSSDNNNNSDNDIEMSNNNNSNLNMSQNHDNSNKKGDMSAFMQSHHATLGLKDARSGHFAMSTIPSYNKAVAEYKKGYLSAQKNQNMSSLDTKDEAFQTGFQDYINGAIAAEKTPDKQMNQGYSGFLLGYQDYRSGLLGAQRNPTHMNATPPHWVYNFAWNCYMQGYNDGLRKVHNNTNKHKGYDIGYNDSNSKTLKKQYSKSDDDLIEPPAKRRKLNPESIPNLSSQKNKILKL